MKVDNVGCFFGWLNRQVTGDVIASTLVRALHLISAYLECQVHIEHLPRKASWEADLVDRLSRENTTTRNDKSLLDSFGKLNVPSCMIRWMEKPTEDWDLPMQLLDSVKCVCEIN